MAWTRWAMPLDGTSKLTATAVLKNLRRRKNDLRRRKVRTTQHGNRHKEVG